MSRRFGRNQKRRMREAMAAAAYRIDQLQQAMEMDRGLLRHQSEKLRRAEDYAAMVADLVGRECVAAGEPIPVRFNYAVDKIELSRTQPMSLGVLPVDFIRYETLRVLKIDAVRGKLAQQMHIRVDLGGGEVRYAISEAALQRMPEKYQVERLAKEIARALVVALRPGAAPAGECGRMNTDFKPRGVAP